MKRTFAIVMVLTMVTSLAIAADLKKMSLDDASIIGTTIQTDSKVKTEGIASVKITTQYPTTVCLGEVAGMNVENTKLIYKAKVKSELDGVAFLEMWAHLDGGQYFSKGINNPIKGKSDWKSIQTPFMLQKGQKPDKVILNIVINGKGTVWIDDVVLSTAPLE